MSERHNREEGDQGEQERRYGEYFEEAHSPRGLRRRRNRTDHTRGGALKRGENSKSVDMVQEGEEASTRARADDVGAVEGMQNGILWGFVALMGSVALGKQAG